MRGQAHTLEAFTAALLVLAGVVFALQATAVTPLTASTANQHIENQERQMAADLLAVADANGTLRSTLLHWNNSTDAFVGAGDRGYFVHGGPPNAFGAALNQTFGDERIAFNVYVRYATGDDSRASVRLVYMGDPSDNAVVATRPVAVYDDTTLTSVAFSSVTLVNSTLYAPDAAPNSPLYNVLEVKIVVWQM